MYEQNHTILTDGREALFGIYRKNCDQNIDKEYTLLAEFAHIIIHDETIILGKD